MALGTTHEPAIEPVTVPARRFTAATFAVPPEQPVESAPSVGRVAAHPAGWPGTAVVPADGMAVETKA